MKRRLEDTVGEKLTMLSAGVSSVMVMNMRKVMEIFPESVIRIWNEWDLRVLVLVSLFLQIVLILLGNRRKYIPQNWIRVILWLAYLAADWIAAVCIGILSNSQGEDENDDDHHHHQSSRASATNNMMIWAFWAPFLLLHLGGPDTITAYSLEDNELWLRHLLGLGIQLGAAFYVFLKSWEGTALNFLAIPMLVSGMIKYGERTWVLWSASSKQFREALLPIPDPGPDYPNFMAAYTSNKSEGYDISFKPSEIEPSSGNATYFDPDPDPAIMIQGDGCCANSSLQVGYNFFNIFKRLFADLTLSVRDRKDVQSFFLNTNWKTAFDLIEIELGFMYDVLYTKATVTYCRLGYLLRSVTLSFTISTFIVFCLVINKHHEYPTIDLTITFSLLVFAIVLEIYAILVLLSSDWTMRKSVRAASFCRLPMLLPAKKRWSDSMAQFNLLSFCLNGKPIKFLKVQKFFGIYNGLEKHYDKKWTIVPPDLKILILQQLKNKSTSVTTAEACKQLCYSRGNLVLEEMNCLGKFGWSIETDFDQSILLWHLATDICYYTDHHHQKKRDSKRAEECKALSDYMLYLLLVCPFMLPQRLGQIRFEGTCKVMGLFQDRKQIMNRDQACEELLKSRTEIPELEVKADGSKSVLFDACVLAESLQLLETEEEWECKKKWEMMGNVWVEMLCYAANQCRWNHHAKQLRRGGELITHVWLLMAHLGISEHFIS